MSLSLITNMGALVASDALTNNQTALQQSISQLSSGKRIVAAKDDPAGINISTVTQGLLGALGEASANTTNAMSYLSTADSALANVGDLLANVQQLATEAADGGFNGAQLNAMDPQYQGILGSINQIATGTQFSGITLFSGAATTFQIGATNTANDQLSIAINKADTTTLAINGTALNTQAGAQAALTQVTSALATVTADRGGVGVSERRLTVMGQNLQSTTANLTAALSSFQDANVAATYATFTKETVLQRSGVQVLKQADQTPSQLLSLFQ